MAEQFVSEPIKPITEVVAARSFEIGAPLLPAQFIWRGRILCAREILEQWKETSPCKHGSGELYVRKHWFRLRTEEGEELKIYFERQPRASRSSAKNSPRWWLFSLRAAEDAL